VILYTFIVGLGATVVWATIMVLSFPLALFLGREKDRSDVLSTTAPRPQYPIRFFYEKIVLLG